ncbi:MAG: DUF3501 family protein [Rhodospirillales bacterium]
MRKSAITRDDILPMDVYGRERRARRAAVTEMKRNRRVHVGPYATFYFESYDTMWHQVHEMLYIEKGGEDQIADELAAYNPLIPKGDELVATVMFEIEDPVRRARELTRIGGVENTMSMTVDGVAVKGVSEEDTERTNADGKASSVQFVHFKLPPAVAAKFKTPGTKVVVSIDHTHYSHMAGMPEEVRAALAQDLD